MLCQACTSKRQCCVCAYDAPHGEHHGCAMRHVWRGYTAAPPRTPSAGGRGYAVSCASGWRNHLTQCTPSRQVRARLLLVCVPEPPACTLCVIIESRSPTSCPPLCACPAAVRLHSYRTATSVPPLHPLCASRLCTMPVRPAASESKLSSMQAETNLNVSWLSGSYTWAIYLLAIIVCRYVLYFTSPILSHSAQWTALFLAHGIVRSAHAHVHRLLACTRICSHGVWHGSCA